MHPRQDASAELTQLAGNQAGLVSAEQAALLGLSHQSLRRLVQQPHWTRISSGVYDSTPGAGSFEKDAWSAALRAGEPCAVGGEAALRLYGLTRCPDQIVIWTPADRRPRSDWSVRMRRDTIGRLDRRRGLLPRIRIDDAVVDVAEQLGIEAAVSLLSEATRQRQTDPRALLRAVEARSRVRHRAMLIDLLHDLDGIESNLEYVYRRDVERAHGLPKARRQQSVSRGTRTDVLYDEFGLLIELDGRAGHVGTDSVFRDFRRDNSHLVNNLATLRYGNSDVRSQPCEVARQVAAVLRARGWSGTPKDCPGCSPTASTL